jgi:hypothetical protein
MCYISQKTLHTLLPGGLLSASSFGSSSAGSSGGGTGNSSGATEGGLKANCTDVSLLQEPNAAALQRVLYCGYAQSRCGGSSTSAAQYAAAFDWRDTSSRSSRSSSNSNDSSVVNSAAGPAPAIGGAGAGAGGSVPRRVQRRSLQQQQQQPAAAVLRFAPHLYYNDTYGLPRGQVCPFIFHLGNISPVFLNHDCQTGPLCWLLLQHSNLLIVITNC